MARNKIGIQVEGIEQYMAKLDEIGGSTAMKRGVESALKASKEYINPQINKAMATGTLPAKGKYSTGETKKSIDTNMNVEWEGTLGSIKLGFYFKQSGLTSIMLMCGTPKMSLVRVLKSAIYGAKTKREIAKLQGEALTKTIKRIMEG